MDSYYIIAGLGNPGRKYENSRHNVGFHVIDELVDMYHIDGPTRFGKSFIGKGRIGAQKVILMKPLTYMNLSGEAVREVVDYYKVDPTDHLIVISDDIDLEVGHLRLRKKGSAGGHNGLKNIIQHFGSDEFMRIRVGVGAKPSPDADLAAYVLGRFHGEDRKIMEEAEKRAAEAAACIVQEGMDLAMNRYNTPKKKKPKKPKKSNGTDPETNTDSETGKEPGKEIPAKTETAAKTETGSDTAVHSGTETNTKTGSDMAVYIETETNTETCMDTNTAAGTAGKTEPAKKA